MAGIADQTELNAVDALAGRLAVLPSWRGDPAKQARLRRTFVLDFARQKLAFQALTKRNLSPSRIRVERLQIYNFAEWHEEGIMARKALAWRVTFTYNKSAEIGRVLFAKRSAGKTLAKDGTLRVVLLKTGDRWLWRPFGW